MYLAVALARLDDVDNASAAYEKALELDDDMMFRLNYGMLLCMAQWQKLVISVTQVVLFLVQQSHCADMMSRMQPKSSLSSLKACTTMWARKHKQQILM